jgi:hypothetical protein
MKYKKIAGPMDIFTPALLHDLGKLVLGRKNGTNDESERQLVGHSPAFIKRLGIEPDELALISGKAAQWIDKLSEKPAFD